MLDSGFFSAFLFHFLCLAFIHGYFVGNSASNSSSLIGGRISHQWINCFVAKDPWLRGNNLCYGLQKYFSNWLRFNENNLLKLNSILRKKLLLATESHLFSCSLPGSHCLSCLCSNPEVLTDFLNKGRSSLTVGPCSCWAVSAKPKEAFIITP